jgi:signal peptidase I
MTYDSEKADPARHASADSARGGEPVNPADEPTAVLPVPDPAEPVAAPAAPDENVPAASGMAPADTALAATAPAGTAPAGSPPHAPPRGGAGRRRAVKAKRKAPWWELPLLVGVAILIAVLVKTFVVQPFYIPSESMEKTLHGCTGCKGDRILVNKPIYDLRDPHPGDIAVFHAPPGWDDEPPSVPPSNPVLRVVRGFGQLVGFVPPDGLVLVKRVIATGGQTVKGDSAGHVMISTHGPGGPFRTLTEHYVYETGSDSHAAFGPVTVPKGRLWVMGDHRNDSADSRFHCGSGATQGPDGPNCDPIASTVPIKDVIGKAVVIAWPPSRWRTLGTPSTFKKAALALGGGLPVAASSAMVVPICLLRRRRRRR